MANLEKDTAWFRKATDFNNPYDSALTIGTREFFDSKNRKKLLDVLAEVFQVQQEKIDKIMSGLTLEEGIEKLLNKYSPVGQNIDSFRKVIQTFIKETDELLESYSTSISNLTQGSVYAATGTQNAALIFELSYSDRS